MAQLKEIIEEAVRSLTNIDKRKDVFHPELGWVVRNGKPTHALITFFKKLERKALKAKERDSSK